MSSSLTAKRRSYVAVQLSIATAGTYNLLDLINVVLAAELKSDGMVCPDACGHLVIQSDPTNGSTKVSIGDSLSGSGRIGYRLVAGESKVYSAMFNTVQVGSMYVTTSADAALVNVEVMTY